MFKFLGWLCGYYIGLFVEYRVTRALNDHYCLNFSPDVLVQLTRRVGLMIIEIKVYPIEWDPGYDSNYCRLPKPLSQQGEPH